MRGIGVICAAFVMGFGLYAGVLSNGYVWDDVSLFLHSDYLRSSEKLFEGLVQPILAGTSYFRPLVLATFAAEFRVFGVDPSISHLVNVLIHVVNAILVGFLARRLMRASGGSDGKAETVYMVAAQAFYISHPALVESVAWAVGRFDLLVTTICLVFLLVAFGGRLQAARIIGLSALFLLALLCKEMAVVIPFLAALMALVVPPNSPRSTLLERVRAQNIHVLLLSCALVLCFYFAAKYYFLGVTSHVDPVVASMWGGASRFVLVGETALFYARMIFWPFPDIGPQHPMMGGILGPGAFFLAFVAGVSSFLMMGVGFFLPRYAIVAVGAVLLSLAPVLNLVPLTIGGNVGHDRFLTLPLAVFSVFLFVGFFRGAGREGVLQVGRLARVGAYAFFALWFAVCAMNVRVTVPLWADDFSLWSWAAAKHGGFAFVRQNYINVLIDKGLYSEALAEIERPLSSAYASQTEKGEFGLARAHVLARMARFPEALAVLESIPDHRRSVVDKLVSQGVRMEDWHIAKVARHNWAGFLVRQTLLAEVLLGMREYDEARKELRYALFVNPKSQGALLLEAFALYGLGHRTEGDGAFQRATATMTPEMASNAQRLRGELFNQLCPPQGVGQCNDSIVLK